MQQRTAIADLSRGRGGGGCSRRLAFFFWTPPTKREKKIKERGKKKKKKKREKKKQRSDNKVPQPVCGGQVRIWYGSRNTVEAFVCFFSHDMGKLDRLSRSLRSHAACKGA